MAGHTSSIIWATAFPGKRQDEAPTPPTLIQRQPRKTNRSKAHVGADHIDCQKPVEAAGLDPAIPWYQIIGNHDQIWMGSVYENAKTWSAHAGSTILNMSNSPAPSAGGVNGSGFYMGAVDGASP